MIETILLAQKMILYESSLELDDGMGRLELEDDGHEEEDGKMKMLTIGSESWRYL